MAPLRGTREKVKITAREREKGIGNSDRKANDKILNIYLKTCAAFERKLSGLDLKPRTAGGTKSMWTF